MLLCYKKKLKSEKTLNNIVLGFNAKTKKISFLFIFLGKNETPRYRTILANLFNYIYRVFLKYVG
jgi:hypothetical protein